MQRITKSVVVGFSGGIDSTAAALYLSSQGYKVTLLTLDTIGDQKLLDSASTRARELGLPLIVADVRDEFKRNIIDYFTSSYLNGLTPAPCSRCNPLIKWRTLYRIAIERGYDHIATGHYFRIAQIEGKFYVRTAADPVKDQSYYLWGVNQECLRMALTPMGDKLKSEVRDSLPSTMKPRESMGVCFLEGVNYSDYLQSAVGIEIKKGDVVDSYGTIVGSHNGCALYTIGQKKGLNIFSLGGEGSIDTSRAGISAESDAQLFCKTRSTNEGDNSNKRIEKAEDKNNIVSIAVAQGDAVDHNGHTIALTEGTAAGVLTGKAVVTAIDPLNNRVIVGSDKDLYHRYLSIGRYNVVDLEKLTSSNSLKIKIRGIGRNPEGFCKATLEHGRLVIESSDALWAAAKGQPIVFYENDIVLGGGILDNFW